MTRGAEKNRQTAKNMAALGAAAAFNYIITFFLTQHITENVGIEAYGFVSIAKTFVQYAQIFTVAMASFIVRYVFMAYENGKQGEAQSFYSSSIAGCAAVSGGIALLMAPIILNLEHFLNIPEGLQAQVKVLFALTFLNFILQTVSIPLSAPAYIKNRLDANGIVQVCSYATDAVTLILLFRVCGPSVLCVGAGACASGATAAIGYWAAGKKLTPGLRFSRKTVDIKKALLLLKNGAWDSLNSLGNTLNSGLDLLISNLMLDGIATGEVSVAKTVGSMMSGICQFLFQAFQPMMLKAYSTGKKEEIISAAVKAMKICGMLTNILIAGLFALGELYYTLWMPGQDSHTLHMLTMLTVAAAATGGVMKPVYYIYTLTLKNKAPCLVTIAGGAANIIGMYLLLKFTGLGAYAVVVTTAVIMVGINLFFNIPYAARAIGASAKPFYITMLRHLASLAAMCAAFKVIACAINPSGWAGLFGSAVTMAATGTIIHCVAQGLAVSPKMLKNIGKEGSNT